MKFWKSREWYVIIAVTSVIFGFNVYRVGTHQNMISLDFVNYAQFITPMKLHGTITKPHFLYPALVAIASILFPSLSYTALGAGFVFAFDLFFATVLWLLWTKVLSHSEYRPFAIALTIASMLLAPINLATIFQHNLYSGYIGITTYHNPPLLLSRPIMLLHFLILAYGVSSSAVSIRNKTVWSFILLVFATLMKPNYATIILPAAAVLAVWAASKKEWGTYRFLVLGTIVPAVLVLGWQYYFTFFTHYAGETNSNVIFAPFFVYSNHSDYLLLRFLLSILFPIVVLIAFWKRAFRDPFYLAGLLTFLFGAFEAYFLAESGARLYDGNFFFSAQIGLFLWFLVSMKLLIEQFFSKQKVVRWTPALIVLTSIFGLHIISGVVWYTFETIATGTYW